MEEFIKHNANIIKLSNDVLCPINDKKKYRTLKLHNNLEIFFVNDKETVISSACIVVGVGQKDDYNDKLGIAHYLEHMLFLGSEKYKGSDQYSQFIENNGGSSNAHTSISKTWYHFDISSAKFMEALDIFGHFFISPLFNKTFVKNEVSAVNSEHSKNIGSDSWRSLEGMKKIINQHHPASRFSTGSLETLLGTADETLVSDENVTNLQKSVKQFFDTKYSADIMRLYVYHNDDSESIINSIKSIFGQITIKYDHQNTKLTIPLYIPDKNKIKILKIVPIDDINTLSVCWVLNRPCNRLNDNLLTSDISIPVISHVLGHEGENSICAMLRRKMLISNMIIYTSYNVDNKCIMDINMTLTNEGLAKRSIILKYIYSFIAFLQSDIDTNKGYYIDTVKELDIKNKLAIKNTPSYDPDSFLQNCASVSDDITIDLNYILVSSILISSDTDAHVEHIRKKLLEMTPDNSFVILSTRSMDTSSFTTEKYYGVKYKIDSYRISDIAGMKLRGYLPNTSRLVSESLLNESIYRSSDQISIYPSKHDICYDTCNKFNDDQVYIQILLVLTDILTTRNALDFAYLLCYVSYINMKYSEELYDLSMGMCNISLILSRTTLKITISTYRSNIDTAIDTVKRYLYNIDDIDEKIVNIVKEELLRNYTNYKKLTPYKKLDNMVTETFNKKYIVSNSEILDEINNINFKNIKPTIDRFFAHGHIKCAISGNINDVIGKYISHRIDTIIEHKAITEIDLTNDLHTSRNIFTHSENKDELNSACFTIFLLDDIRYGDENWAKISCMISILSTLIHAEYFHQMRTLGKLGYVVVSSPLNLNILTPLNKKAIYFLVQSTKMRVVDLHNKTMEVVKENITSKIKNLNSNEFVSLKLGLLANLKSPDKNVADRLNRIFSGINNKDINGNIKFDYDKKLINALVGDRPADILSCGVTLPDIVSYYNKKFVDNKTVMAVGIDRSDH
jgi:insulysin